MNMDYLPHNGHSMWPLLCQNDEVGVQFLPTPISVSECQIGQIVLYKENHEWVLHRVISYNGRKVLKGDFSNSYFYSEAPVVWGTLDDQMVSRPMAWISASTLNCSVWQRKVKKLLLYSLAKIQRQKNGRLFLRNRVSK